MTDALKRIDGHQGEGRGMTTTSATINIAGPGWAAGRVHRMDGFAPAGPRVRAVCSCGHRTTARADRGRALKALATEHGLTRPQCALCGRDCDGMDWVRIKTVLWVLADPIDGEFLACAGAPRECRDAAAQRQVHLDRAAFDSLGVQAPRPQLRAV